MDYCETLEFIHSLGNFSKAPTLERIKKVLNVLGSPQNRFKSIHIAGTNGKGSVSVMTANVFKTAGYKTGLFISPFVINFRERIQINGEFITENDLVYYAQKVKNTNIELTEFEFITATAFLYFANQNIDILICETGLGGRLDATNTLDNVIVNVITKIGLDHTAILGDTIEKIAEEKCGILRSCKTVTSYNQHKAALDVIKSYDRNVIIPDINKLNILKSGINNTYIYDDKKYELSLSGSYQVENSLISIEAVKATGYDIPYEAIYKGLYEASFPARMEIISRNPLVVLDGAHNPDGAEALCEQLKEYSGKVTAIIGMMKDKNYEDFLKSTLKHCKAAVVVEVQNMPRSLSAKELFKTAKKYSESFIANDYASAITLAIKNAEKNPIFIFGSLYLASQIRTLLKDFFKP